MAGNKWFAPPLVFYTAAQVQQHEETRLAALKQRTEDRSPKSVDEAVGKLRKLLALPERQDLIVELGWELQPDGEIERKVLKNGKELGQTWCPGAKVMPSSPPGRRTIEQETSGLLLTKEGLFFAASRRQMMSYSNAPSRWDWVRWWQPVAEDEYEYVVGRFQLFTTQLDFLIKSLTAK